MTNQPSRKTSQFQIDKGSHRKLSQFVEQTQNEGLIDAKTALALPCRAENNPNSPNARKSASAPAEINQQGKSKRASQDTPLSGERETVKKSPETTYGFVENQLSRKTSDYQCDKGQQKRTSQPVDAVSISKQPVAVQQVSKMDANIKKRNSGEGGVVKEIIVKVQLGKDGRKNSASKELSIPVKIVQNPQIQEAIPKHPKVVPDLKPKSAELPKRENKSLGTLQQSRSAVSTQTSVTKSSSESSLTDKGHRLERKRSKEDLRKISLDDEEYCFEKTLPSPKVSKKKIVSSNADEWDDEEFYFEKTAEDKNGEPNASVQGKTANVTVLPDKLDFVNQKKCESNLPIVPLPKEASNLQEVMKQQQLPKEQLQVQAEGSGQIALAQEPNRKEIQMRSETKQKQISDTRAEREILRPANAFVELTSSAEQSLQNQPNKLQESQSQVEKNRIEKLRQDYQEEQNQKQEQRNLAAKLQREKEAELDVQKNQQKQAELEEEKKRQQAEFEAKAKLQQQQQAEIDAQNEQQRLAELEEKEQRMRQIQLEVIKQRERLEQIRKAELEAQKERELKAQKEAELKRHVEMQQRTESEKSQQIAKDVGSAEVINKQLTKQAAAASKLSRDEQPSSTRSPSRSSMKSSRDKAGARKKSRDPRKILLNSDVAVIHVPLSDYVEDDKVLKKVPKRN